MKLLEELPNPEPCLTVSRRQGSVARYDDSSTQADFKKIKKPLITRGYNKTKI
jgi:hypothetical protein